ncbi:Unknown protein sequence [Pseudomonas syringae pv. aceris]|nr:Unknown protein sequence [Pseudomonas syringae pv. aceris]
MLVSFFALNCFGFAHVLITSVSILFRRNVQYKRSVLEIKVILLIGQNRVLKGLINLDERCTDDFAVLADC